jgi:predicted nucleotidyltransferase
MIAEKDKNVIIESAKKYNAKYVVLFGTSASNLESNDIDIAVKGIKPENFFKFYAEIFRKATKPVDLIDLNEKSVFNSLVEKNGIRIYG